MRRILRPISFITAALLLTAVCAGPASAITVTNVTSDTVVFFDDFETAPGVTSSSYPNTDGDFDPDNIGYAGSWSIDENFNTYLYDIQVTDATVSPPEDPGAIQGNNYGRFGRDETAPVIGGYAVFDTNVTTGNTVRAELVFAMNENSETSSAGISFFSGVGGEQLTTVSFTPGGAVRNNNMGTNEGTGMSWNTTQWNYLAMEYVVGQSTYSLTINGQTEPALPIRATTTPTAVGALFFAGHDSADIEGGRLYVDEAPDYLELQVNPASGVMRINNPSNVDAWSTYFYEVSGPENSLDPVNWNSLDDQNYDNIGTGIGESWDEAGASSSSAIGEAYLLSNSEFSPGEFVSLGQAYNDDTNLGGLTFEYRDATTDDLVEGTVLYITPGDMNGDGDLTDADVSAFVQALVDRTAYQSNYPDVDADFVGDFDGNGLLDLGDVKEFSEAVSLASAASANGAVPEPSTCMLWVIAVGCSFFGTRRRN